MTLSRRFVTLAAASVAGLVLASCGGDENTGAAGSATDGAEHGGAILEHVHGLGVDSNDGRLYIATHNGLFSAPKGDTTPERVGDSQQDVMGFTIAGPNRFLGSGHPAPGQALPSHLGLIESRDGGETWQPVSLLGEADFHVLQSAARTVYGFDATQGRLMVSGDGGRTWRQRTPPAAMFSLAIEPGDASSAVAATERGLYSSRDGGRTWRPLRDQLAGLLAWPDDDELYLVDGGGDVRLSADGGARWIAVGAIGGQPAAFAAAGDALYVALADGTVKQSADGGATWTVRTTA